MDIDYKEKNKMENFNLEKDNTTSLVSNLLKPIYTLIYKIIPKSIGFSAYIWYILTILILLLCVKYRFFELNSIIILFILILILEFGSLNFDIIKNIFQDKSELKIKEFIKNLDKYDLGDITDFLKKNALENKYLISLLKTRYKTNIDLHKNIIRTQFFTCDFVDHLISIKLMDKLPPYILSRYILWCNNSLNKYSLDYFNKNRSIEIIGALVLTHPLFLKTNELLKFISKPFLFVFIKITHILRKPNLRLLVTLFIFSFIGYISSGRVVNYIYKRPDSLSRFVYFMGFIILGLIISVIIFKIFEWIVLKIILPLCGIIFKKSLFEYR